MDDQEKQWLDAYRRGDVEALGRLVEQYRRPLFAFIIRMTENNADAEEIFQEVWFRAVKNLDKYQDGKFLSWLFRIAHNLVIDRARKRKPDCSLQDKQEEDLELQEKIASPGLGPAHTVAGHDLGQAIRKAVSRLPDDQKEVFLLRTEADMSFKEIAAIQQISINTALARMQYALGKLRQDLSLAYEEIREDVS